MRLRVTGRNPCNGYDGSRNGLSHHGGGFPINPSLVLLYIYMRESGRESGRDQWANLYKESYGCKAVIYFHLGGLHFMFQ